MELSLFCYVSEIAKLARNGSNWLAGAVSQIAEVYADVNSKHINILYVFIEWSYRPDAGLICTDVGSNDEL